MSLLAPRTIRGRVALATSIVLAGVLAVAGIVIDEEVRRSAMAELDTTLAAEAEVIGTLARVEAGGIQFEAGGDTTLTLFDTPRGGEYFQVSAPPRRPLLSESLVRTPLPAPTAAELAPLASPKERRSSLSTADGPFEPRIRIASLTVSRPILAEGQELPARDAPRATVVVQVAKTFASVDNARRSVRGALGLALPLALLVGTAGAFLVARRATVPIARLSAQAAEIGEASLSVRLESGRVVQELRDLSDTLNLAFDRLSAAVERERREAADAAHELRTPLAVLRSRIELALSRERDPEEYRAALRTAFDAGTRLERVVDSLLVLSRAEAGAGARDRVDLRGTLAAAIEAAEPLARASGVEIASSMPEDEIPVVGDATLLERLVSNLLENAIRHGGTGGIVEAGLSVEEGSAVVSVLDRGPGFPPDLVPHLFERFARGDVSRTRTTGGAGLGLAIARAIAKAHGGDVAAAPRAGGGAALRATLPIAKAPVRERLPVRE